MANWLKPLVTFWTVCWKNPGKKAAACFVVVKLIRNSHKNDTRTIVYTTASLNTDSGFLMEVGSVEIKNNRADVKVNGKYLVVWKNEYGDWKPYRDIGL